MGNIGEPISPSIPTVGTSGAQYATDINAILGEVVTRLTSKIPLSSLITGTDFSMGGAKLTDTGAVVFTDQANTPAGAPFRRAASFGGDLHWVSPSGTVKITAGGALNSAAIGGITGDYGGVDPAQFRFDTINNRYDAYADFGTGTWADVRARAFGIAGGATSLVHARLMFAGAANKTYTFPPAAATSADRPLYMDAAGQIKLGHGTYTLTYSSQGAATVTDLQTVVTGTGFVAGGAGFEILNPALVSLPRASPITTTKEGALKTVATTPAGSQYAAKGVNGVPAGFKISSFTVNYFKVDTTAAFTFALKKINAATLVETTLASGSDNVFGSRNVTVNLGAPEVVDPTCNYWFEVNFSTAGGAGSELWFGFQLTGTMDP